MSPEKLFIRDLINLCEQYGMIVCFPVANVGIIVHANETNNLYNGLLDGLKELQ